MKQKLFNLKHLFIGGVLLLSILNCSCFEKSKSYFCQNSYLFVHALSIDNSILPADKVNDSIVSIIDNLNHSNYSVALNQAKSLFPYENITYNGFRGIIPIEKTNNSFWGSYIAYRLSSFHGDLDYNTLFRILIANYSQGVESGDSSCVNTLLEIEGSYLYSFADDRKESNLQKAETFKKFMYEYPSSKRLKYLWADLSLKSGVPDSALILLKELFNVGYYQIPILKILTSYYQDKNQDSLRFYLNEFERLSPLECNTNKILLMGRENNLMR